MPFNGIGGYTLVAGNPVVTGTTISSTVQNNTMTDFANGFANCVTRDGQSPATANIPMGGFKLTGLAAGTTNGDAVRWEQAVLLTQLADPTSAANGANLVAYNPALVYTLGIGALLNNTFGRTVAEIAVSVTPTNYAYFPGDVRRYGAVGDYNGTTGTENLTAFQNCILVAQASSDQATYTTNSPAAGTSVMFVPDGNYKVTGTLTVTKKISVVGPGPAERASGARILQFNNAVDLIRLEPQAQGMSFTIYGVTLAGTAGGAGHLLHSTRTSANCNSARVIQCFFGAPPSMSIRVDAGDDWQILGNTFDVSNAHAIGIGTATAADAVTNIRITGNDFFEIPTRVILLYNVDGYVIANNQVTRQGATRTAKFIDAVDTAPYQVKNGVVSGNQLNSCDTLFKGTLVQGLSLTGNVGVLMGTGAFSNYEFTGANKNITISGETMEGNWGALNVYNDAGGTVTGVTVAGNTFTATGGAGAPFVSNASIGKFDTNTLIGFTATSPAMQEVTANLAQWVRGENSEEITLSTVGLTTDSTANLLPAGAYIEAVVAIITATITTTTNWALGDPTTSGRFAPANATLVGGTKTIGLTHVDQTGAAGPRQTAAAKVRITCTGANPGAGKIRVTVFYRQFVAPTS